MNEMSAVRAVYLVARREFVTRVRSRVFLIGTVIAVVAMGAYAVFQLVVLDRIDTTPSYSVGFTADARPLARPLRAAAPALGIALHVSDVPGEAQGESQVRAGRLDALVTGAPGSPRVVVESGLAGPLRSALNALVRQEVLSAELRSAGLDPAAVQARANAASIQVQVLQPPAPNGLQQPIAGAVVAFLLYVFLQIYGGLIAQGVVAEKASRVVEILLSTVRPGQLLAGKIAGIGLVGLFQLLVIGVAGLALLLPTRVLTIPTVATSAIAGGLLWFVLGFVLYALLLATTAAPVSRIEEVQSASLPVTLLLVMGWILTASVLLPEAFGAASPNSGLATAATVLSLVPPFTPVMMPIRVAAGDVPAWQVLLALVLMLASIAAVAWVAARVYANSVLRFGARVHLVDALRAVRGAG